MAQCIICRKEKKDLTDEHVIPDALGGYYHIYTVCKTCNSKLGSYVDTKLINHLFSVFQRYSLGLKGKSGQIPNPFAGTHVLKDDQEQKIRLEQDENGVFVPYLIMIPPKVIMEDEKTTITIKIDIRDKERLPKILHKIAQRNHIKVDNLQIDEDLDKFAHKFRPEVLVKTSVDLDEFKIGLLKIAYEFAIDSIPEYFNDKKAILISNMLEKCQIKNTDKGLFIGSGFEKGMFESLKWMLDISSNKHYLVLCPIKEFGLICMIYLSNTFSIAIKLSDKEYLVEDCIFGINDIANKKFEKLNIFDLHERVYGHSRLRFEYWFKDENELFEFQKLQQNEHFEFYKDHNGNQPLYNVNGEIKYKDINEKLELLIDKVININTGTNDLVNEVRLDEDLYIKVNPGNRLLKVTRVRSEQEYLGSI